MATAAFTAAPATPARAGRLAVLVAGVQGVFYLATGVWPLVHMGSFLAVTGPKRDLWLVDTVGVLVAVVGAVLLVAAGRRRVPLELGLVAAGAAAALAGVDVVFVSRGVIDRVYLLDAAAEGVLLLGWAAAAASGSRGR